MSSFRTLLLCGWRRRKEESARRMSVFGQNDFATTTEEKKRCRPHASFPAVLLRAHVCARNRVRDSFEVVVHFLQRRNLKPDANTASQSPSAYDKKKRISQNAEVRSAVRNCGVTNQALCLISLMKVALVVANMATIKMFCTFGRLRYNCNKVTKRYKRCKPLNSTILISEHVRENDLRTSDTLSCISAQS